MKIINEMKEKYFSFRKEQQRAILLSGVFFLICTALGVLFHFAFDFLGEPKWLAPFVPVNESIWEHLKLIFVPYIIILGPIEYFLYGRDLKRFIPAKLCGVTLAMTFIVMEYYTIKGVFGSVPGFLNIVIYCISTLLAYIMPIYLSFKAKGDSSSTANFVSLFTLAVIFVFFIAFTYYPPKIPLFLDETGAGYGYYRFS